jgi:glycosyltransferase involved in cell wall biosynthesis
MDRGVDRSAQSLRARRHRGGGMRVLHVSSGISPRIGGSAMMALESASPLLRFGVETSLFAPDLAVPVNAKRYWSVRPDDVPALAGHARVFPTHPPRRLAFSPALYRSLRREARDYDVVHVHNLWTFPQFAAHRESLRAGTGLVVAPCGALDPLRRGRSRRVKRITTALWQGKMLDDAHVIHFKTRAEAERVADLVPPEKGMIVPNGIRWDFFQQLPDPSQFRRQHLQGHGGPIVMTLGRISWEKRLDVLIEAFARVADEFQDAVLVIVGPDDEDLAAGLTASAAALSIGGRVRFIGSLAAEAKLEALAAADVWCQSSQFENFGLAAVEALAAGLPAVISNGVQLADEIGGAGAALLAPPTPESFADSLRRLLGDTELCRDLAERGREFAREFDWDSIAPRLLAMYTEAVARAGG